MCIVFFRKTPPVEGVKLVVVFNRDESVKRERTALGLHFDSILCGLDLEAQGTWLGVNVKTGAIGFLTNYEHKPFTPITDPAYRKGNLLMDYLRLEEHDGKYLERFLSEGHRFNGTNIWLGNVSDGDLVFAHNQVPSGGKIEPVKDGETVTFANGRVGDEWFKQRLGRRLMDRAFEVASDVSTLKQALFRAAECTTKPKEESEWPPLELYTPEERYENSSVHLNVHPEHLADGSTRLYATVSTSVLILCEDGTLHFFERRYDHGSSRSDLEVELSKTLAVDEPNEFSDAAFEECLVTHHFSPS